MRYKDAIEHGERLYLAEIPKLVTPNDEKVASVANTIKTSFQAYNFDDNFRDAAKKAYDYVKTSIQTIAPPIQFWLRPSEVMELGAGDVFDKNTLLCSILIGLGNVSAKIISTVNDGNKKHKVYCELKEKIIAMDLEDGIQEFGSKEELLKAMGITESEEIDAYEFNDKMYNDLP